MNDETLAETLARLLRITRKSIEVAEEFKQASDSILELRRFLVTYRACGQLRFGITPDGDLCSDVLLSTSTSL